MGLKYLLFRFTGIFLMLMFMLQISVRAKSCDKSYDGCAMRVVFSFLRKCSGGMDDDFRAVCKHVCKTTPNIGK